MFETLFFTVTAVIEGLSSISNMFLFCYQRNKPDLSQMNNFDCKSSCFYNMFRIVWTLALSIFVLMDVDSLFKAGDPYKTITTHYRNKAQKEWGAISTLPTVIMLFEIVYILGYVIGLLYQPEDFSREICFDQIGGGVITEVDAMARMDQLKEHKIKRHRTNVQRLKDIKLKQKQDREKVLFLGQDFRHRNLKNGQSGFLRDFKKIPEDSIENKENDPYYQFQQYKVYKE